MNSAFLQGLRMRGIPGVIAYAAYVFGRGSTLNLRTIRLTAGILAILFAFRIHPIIPIFISGTVGMFIFRKGES